MSRSGAGSRLHMKDYQNPNLFDMQSTTSLKGKSKDIIGNADETTSLFNYAARSSPSKNAKSILYRLHNKPKK